MKLKQILSSVVIAGSILGMVGLANKVEAEGPRRKPPRPVLIPISPQKSASNQGNGSKKPVPILVSIPSGDAKAKQNQLKVEPAHKEQNRKEPELTQKEKQARLMQRWQENIRKEQEQREQAQKEQARQRQGYQEQAQKDQAQKEELKRQEQARQDQARQQKAERDRLELQRKEQERQRQAEQKRQELERKQREQERKQKEEQDRKRQEQERARQEQERQRQERERKEQERQRQEQERQRQERERQRQERERIRQEQDRQEKLRQERKQKEEQDRQKRAQQATLKINYLEDLRYPDKFSLLESNQKIKLCFDYESYDAFKVYQQGMIFFESDNGRAGYVKIADLQKYIDSFQIESVELPLFKYQRFNYYGSLRTVVDNSNDLKVVGLDSEHNWLTVIDESLQLSYIPLNLAKLDPNLNQKIADFANYGLMTAKSLNIAVDRNLALEYTNGVISRDRDSDFKLLADNPEVGSLAKKGYFPIQYINNRDLSLTEGAINLTKLQKDAQLESNGIYLPVFADSDFTKSAGTIASDRDFKVTSVNEETSVATVKINNSTRYIPLIWLKLDQHLAPRITAGIEQEKRDQAEQARLEQERNRALKDAVRPVGLTNVGNYCFMNTACQILINDSQLFNYMTNGAKYVVGNQTFELFKKICLIYQDYKEKRTAVPITLLKDLERSMLGALKKADPYFAMGRMGYANIALDAIVTAINQAGHKYQREYYIHPSAIGWNQIKSVAINPGGHWEAAVKRADGTWYLCSDSSVSEMTSAQVLQLAMKYYNENVTRNTAACYFFDK